MVTENQIYYHMNSLIPASDQGKEAREELAKDRREDEGYQEAVEEKDDNSVNTVLHVLSQCGTLQLVYFSPFQPPSTSMSSTDTGTVV